MAKYYFSSSSGSNSTGDGSVTNPWFSFAGKKDGVGDLSPGDICYFKAGDIWYGSNAQLQVLSSGTAGNPIIFDRYGVASAADPIFCGSQIQTGWTLVGTSSHSGGGSIYRKSGLQYSYTIGVDGTYALCDTNGEIGTGALPKGSFVNSGGYIYINLSDGSDPSGHSIYVPVTNYWSDNYFGLVNAGYRHSTGSKSNGNYVQFNHLQSWYNNRTGFSSSGLSVYFNDCTALGNAGEGFLFTNKSSGTAQGSRAYRCTASYNSAGGTGWGQCYTTRAANTWFINCSATNNFMANFDFLNGESALGDDCSNSGMIYCTSYLSGQSLRTISYDAGVYIDGGHDILIYGNTIHGCGRGNQTFDAPGIFVSTEHQSFPTYNNHIINNLVYDCAGYCIWIRNGGDYPDYNNAPATYGNTVVNNTCINNPNDTGSGNYGAVFIAGGLGTSVKTIIKNNIFYTTGGSQHTFRWVGGMTSSVLDMDYNCYYDPNKSAIFTDADSTPNYTLAQWRASVIPDRSGLDTHSIQSNPNIVNSSFSAMDARLTVATSPCINAGVSSPWTPPSWIATADVLADDGAVVGTTRPDGVVDSGAMDIGYHYYAPTPYGSLTATNVQPATLYVGTTNTVTVSFTTATALPSDGKIVVTFPTTLGGGFSFDSGGTSAAAFTVGGSGSLTLSRVGNVVTLTRSGGSTIAANTAVQLTITYVANPPQVGSTGAYLIKTTDSAGTSIDVDNNVSADQIIAPPAGFVTITISGIKLSQIKFNN